MTNQSGGSIVGTSIAIEALAAGSTTIVNAGLVRASVGNAIYLPDGGSVTNAAGGTISSQSHGILATGGKPATVVNDGVILGGRYGVSLVHGTVVDAGTIAGLTAVQFAAGGQNLLVLLPGSNLQGTANGGGGTGSTLELASAASAGTLSLLGYRIIGFAQVTVDAGATWAFGSSDIVGNGVTLSNAGTLAGPVTIGGGMLINAVGGTVVGSGTAAVYGVTGGPGAVVNFGTIDPALYGVYLTVGGSVTNAAGALIDGINDGVLVKGGAGTVIDAGTIVGGIDAVSLAAGFANRMVLVPGYSLGGIVDGGNTIGGTAVSTLELASAASAGALGGFGSAFIDFARITVDAGASWAFGGSDPITAGIALTNAGTLTGAVTLLSGGILTNASSGTILRRGANFGAVDLQTAGQSTAYNAGLIDGGNYFGIYAPGGGAITNISGGTVAGGFAAIADNSGPDLTVVNAGLISSTNQTGIRLAQGMIGNTSSGTITGRNYGIFQSSVGPLTVVNAGLIVGTRNFGIDLAGGSTVTNASGGSIAGYHAGIYVQSGSAATVINAGVISATQEYGVRLLFGGYVSNASGGTITAGGGGLRLGAGNPSTVVNTGLISGVARYGLYLGGGGVVSNASSGTIAGRNGGITIAAGGTVIDAGTISNNVGFAVRFAAGHVNRLVLLPGFYIPGPVDGGSTIGSTLELASAAATGTIASLGLLFQNFGTVAVDAGATWEFTGTTNTITGALVNDGGIVLDPTSLIVGDLLGSGSITIQTGSTLEVTGTIASTETIVFQGANAYLHLDNPTHAYGSVIGFAASDSIDLKGVDPASVSAAAGTLTFGAGYSFPLNSTAFATASPDGTVLTTLCFLPDTLIQTPSGQVKVQELAVGEIVSTFSGGERPVVWIGNGAVLATPGRRGPATPVLVRRHAFAANVPNMDLRVTKGHAFWFDGVLIPVEFLVNHRSIVWDDRAQEVSVFHVELDGHDVLIANGAPAESYRDDGNRWLVRNANSGWGQPAKAPCAPVLTGGAIVDAVWRRLLDRAGPRPGFPSTTAADLHLSVDGRRIDAASRRGDWHVFRLAARPNAVRIASRAASPQELGVARDPRVLGVAVLDILLICGRHAVAITVDDARLADGFHEFEPDLSLRWTDGWAALPEALFDGLVGPIEVRLRVGGTARYIDDRAEHRSVA